MESLSGGRSKFEFILKWGTKGFEEIGGVDWLTGYFFELLFEGYVWF